MRLSMQTEDIVRRKTVYLQILRLEREDDNMKKITADCWRHIPAGETVWNGFLGGQCTAPAEEGTYTLYELVDDKNCHCGWEWKKEEY